MNVENAFKDLEYTEGVQLPTSYPLNIISGGCHLYGYLLQPDSRYAKPAPTAIVFHGFPGYTTNNDLEYALMRMGCVVIHVNHRGAWGSEGFYLFSNLVDDAVAIAKWAHNPAVADQYNIDTTNIFLIGHSMGGMTVLNAAKQLPFIKGVAAIAPYDLEAAFLNRMEKDLFLMIEIEGQCLKMTSASDVFENALDSYNQLSIYQTHQHLIYHNVLTVAATLDTVAPPSKMLMPLAKKLQSENYGTGSFKLVEIESNHSLSSARTILAIEIGKWMQEKCNISHSTE